MHEWYKANYFAGELLVKKRESTDPFEPLNALITRVGSADRPFLATAAPASTSTMQRQPSMQHEARPSSVADWQGTDVFRQQQHSQQRPTAPERLPTDSVQDYHQSHSPAISHASMQPSRQFTTNYDPFNPQANQSFNHQYQHQQQQQQQQHHQMPFGHNVGPQQVRNQPRLDPWGVPIPSGPDLWGQLNQSAPQHTPFNDNPAFQRQPQQPQHFHSESRDVFASQAQPSLEKSGYNTFQHQNIGGPSALFNQQEQTSSPSAAWSGPGRLASPTVEAATVPSPWQLSSQRNSQHQEELERVIPQPIGTPIPSNPSRRQSPMTSSSMLASLNNSPSPQTAALPSADIQAKPTSPPRDLASALQAESLPVDAPAAPAKPVRPQEPVAQPKAADVPAPKPTVQPVAARSKPVHIDLPKLPPAPTAKPVSSSTTKVATITEAEYAQLKVEAAKAAAEKSAGQPTLGAMIPQAPVTPSTKPAPWAASASPAEEAPSHANQPSLREIQLKEAKEEEIRKAAEKKARQAAQAAEQAAAAARAQAEAEEALPAGSKWGASASTTTAPQASPQSAATWAKANPAGKKTLKEIQEEEAKQQKRLAAQKQTVGQPVGRGYAGMVGPAAKAVSLPRSIYGPRLTLLSGSSCGSLVRCRP